MGGRWLNAGLVKRSFDEGHETISRRCAALTGLLLFNPGHTSTKYVNLFQGQTEGWFVRTRTRAWVVEY